MSQVVLIKPFHVLIYLNYSLKDFSTQISVCAYVYVTCLSVSYGAYEAIMGEMNGLHRARGVVISEGHQGGVINHL